MISTLFAFNTAKSWRSSSTLQDGYHTITKILFGSCQDCVREHGNRCAHMAQLLVWLAYLEDSYRCTPVGRDAKTWASAASTGGECGHAPLSLLADEDEEFAVAVPLKHIKMHAKRPKIGNILHRFKVRLRRKRTQTEQDMRQNSGRATSAPTANGGKERMTVASMSAKLLAVVQENKSRVQSLPRKRKGDARFGQALVERAKKARAQLNTDKSKQLRVGVKSYAQQVRAGAIPLTAMEVLTQKISAHVSFDQSTESKETLREEIEADLGYIVPCGPRREGYRPPSNADRESLWLRGFKGASTGFHMLQREKQLRATATNDVVVSPAI